MASPTLYACLRGYKSVFCWEETCSLIITFQLLKAIKRRPGYTEEQIDKEAVLVRAYGNGTEVLIDRESN